MKLNNNYFEKFALPISCEVDLEQLEQRYLSLQKQCHPDRFSHRSERDQRLAVQYIADLNHAYGVLKSPLMRAQYLLTLCGYDESKATVPHDTEFLMEQMMLRESLSDVAATSNPFESLEAIQQQAESNFDALQNEFTRHYQSGALDEAAARLAKMQFYSKLMDEVEQLEYNLEA